MFAVITVVRNDLEGLRRTVESVLRQSAADWELVLIDGASTDGSAGYVHDAQNRDDRIVSISEPDSGIYEAMNKGILLSTGALVIFMNAGDVFASEDVLEMVADSYRSDSWGWAYGYVQRFDGGRSAGPSRRGPIDIATYLMGSDWIAHQAAFLPGEWLRRSGGYRREYGVAADQELMLRLSLSEKGRYLPIEIAHFLNGGAHSKLTPERREWLWLLMAAPWSPSRSWWLRRLLVAFERIARARVRSLIAPRDLQRR